MNFCNFFFNVNSFHLAQYKWYINFELYPQEWYIFERFGKALCHITEWTIPQMSIMIIYNCTWSILIQ